MENLTDLNIKKRAAQISLTVGICMFFAKITAYLLTGSSAIFSDAAESVVHVAATSMALYSIILSSKPADASHLYGHGKVEYFSAGTEGALIIIAAITIIYSAISDIVKGTHPSQLDIGTTIVAAAGVVNLFLGFYLIRKGKSTNSLTLVADGKHVLTDSYTSIGVVIGLVLVLLTNFYLLDPLVAVLVALNIIYTGYKLIRESIGGLMNETDPAMLETIVNFLNEKRNNFWIDIHHLRFWKSANFVYIDFHLILPYYFTIQQSHVEEKEIEDRLLEIIRNLQVRIHADYCNTDLCKFCGYPDCTIRIEKQSRNFKWDKEKMIGDPVIIHGHIT